MSDTAPNKRTMDLVQSLQARCTALESLVLQLLDATHRSNPDATELAVAETPMWLDWETRELDRLQGPALDYREKLVAQAAGGAFRPGD